MVAAPASVFRRCAVLVSTSDSQQHGSLGQPRDELTQQPHTLVRQIGADIRDAGHITARAGEARDQTPSYGIIISVAHNDGDCGRRALGGLCRLDPQYNRV